MKTSVMSRSYPRQRGVTLIELMISLVISLMVLAGASIVLVNANKSNRLQEGLLGLQENARFGIQQMMDDLQLAGYYGCVQDLDPTDPAGPIISKIDTSDFLNAPLLGYETGDASGSTLTATNRDVLEVQFARPVARLTADMASPISALSVDDSSQFEVDDIAMIASCESGDIFTVSAVAANVVQHQTAIASGATLTKDNATDSLASLYPGIAYRNSPTRIFEFSRVKYYVANDANNVPTLFRTINKGMNDAGDADEAFIRGVDAFEVLYGEDTDNDNRPDSFVAAPAVTNWGNVAAVRIGLLLRTENEYGSDFDKNADSGDTISVLGTDFVADNARVRRRLYQTTVYVRNTI